MPHLSAGRKARTLFGWTPGLRRLICGQCLECGCLTGIYETTRSRLVTIIDHTAVTCTVPGHAMNMVLDATTHPIEGDVAGRNQSMKGRLAGSEAAGPVT